MVSALEGAPGITGASPEVFAFSSYGGVSFVMRGVELDRLNSTGPSFREFSLAGGESAVLGNSALIGDRLLGRLGIEIPYTLPLVGSYSSRMEFVRVVGSFSTDSPLDDELLVSLDVARFLSGMSSDKVSIIRVATDDPDWLAGVLSPANARFTIFDLHTSKGEVAVGEDVSVSVGVRNWGGSAGSATVSFSEGAQSIAEVEVSLAPSQSSTVTRNFSSEQLGDRSIAVSVAGDFPVTLYANFTVIEPYLRLSAPAKVLLGSAFNVSVSKFSGDPAEGALVTFGSQSSVADAAGRVSFTVPTSGTWTVTAELSGLSSASATVQVQDPSAFPSEFLPSIVDFSVLPEVIKESEPARCVLTVSNGGSVAGWFEAQVLVDAEEYSIVNVSLAGMSSATIRFELSGISPGSHVVQAGTFSRQLVVESWIADNPDLVQLVIRYGSSTSLSTSASIPIYQAAKISEGNVSAALFAIGAVSALLAALAIVSIYSREIHESRRKLGILRTIGASSGQLRRLVFGQALPTGLAGAAIGIGLGVLVSYVLSEYGVFAIFGHQLSIDFDPQILVIVFLSSVAISVAAALVSSQTASRESVVSSIRGYEDEGGFQAGTEDVSDR